MPLIADTPESPYYAVIFTSTRTENDDGYHDMAARMAELASKQPGFLGMESAAGITICYWSDLKSISAWKTNLEHREAQRLGREKWYSTFRTRICKVEREYGT